MRRRGSSKIRYSRGGAPEYIMNRDDLSGEIYTKYQIVYKKNGNALFAGNIEELTEEQKDKFFLEYAKNPEYDFMVL
jgi:hypothetical protein